MYNLGKNLKDICKTEASDLRFKKVLIYILDRLRMCTFQYKK